MKNLYFNRRFLIKVFVMMLIGFSFVCKGQISHNVIDDLLFSYFTMYGPDVCMIIFLANFIEKNIKLSPLYIVRIGKETFYQYQIGSGLILIFVYYISQFGLALALNTIWTPLFMHYLLLFMVGKGLCLLVIQGILQGMNIGLKKGIAVLVSVIGNIGWTVVMLFYMMS